MSRREHIPAKLRHEVFQRDNYRCRECGATNKETTLEIDHILPVSKGGTNELSNLQTLCKKCNRAKHTRTWVGGTTSQTGHKSKITTGSSVVKCSCGFKYNTRFHNTCPNCVSNKKQKIYSTFKISNYNNGASIALQTLPYGSKPNVKKCPNCGTVINNRAKKCIVCNYDLSVGRNY